ncbi:MAG: glycogen/starch/alpha-glucan phosphorylase [Thermodesulfobacteriota bacterium]|nr:glycogen/starch/alpha-glucan phosphorylase [Thermodesulfobacteriota bacterium]
MTDTQQTRDKNNSNDVLNSDILKKEIFHNIRFNLGQNPDDMNRYSCFMGLAYSLKERLIKQWLQTQQACKETMSKRIFYLSLEFLPGRFLKNYLISLGIEDLARNVLSDFGFDIDEIEEEEWDAGLGNGGLGRLASCYMDSMARLRLPGYGYGIRYNFGIFHQILVNGFQQERSDNWMRRGNPFEIIRYENIHKIQFYGRSEAYTDINGKQRYRWVETENVMAMACDILIPGVKDEFVTNMRLWVAKSSRGFNLEFFNKGDYVGAVENKVLSETISKVLYPSDELEKGRELRLKQQYFFVSATLRDILEQYKAENQSFSSLSDWAAIQLNDTHPSIAIPELMRILMDDEGLNWDESWSICQKTFAYTNHTVLPEALEKWPAGLLSRLLPRHMEIIQEINQRFLNTLKKQHPDKPDLPAQLSIIQEGDEKQIRMAHLAIIGSHSVNGVAALHSTILKKGLFKEFNKLYPGKIKNVTNGITPRRWLFQCNPTLSKLITKVIGPDWVTNLDHLKRLIPYADDSSFQAEWQKVKLENKKKLARYTLRKTGIGVNPNTLFDIHAKRMHEYKRQLLNILQIIALYNRIREKKESSETKRSFFFAGKAAPSYFQAKLIIKLITSVSETISKDPLTRGKLNVIFLPNYCISQAEKIIPAADISEQISTAGLEASGTGNMKFALNGALTIGTLDGANVEIMEEVGKENIFIFGLKADEVVQLRSSGYNPGKYYEENNELKKVLDMIDTGFFSPDEPQLFKPIVSSLLDQGDFYLLLADFASYVQAQKTVGETYQNQAEWTKRSILNTANMGKFSSDRAVMEYADNIWDAAPLVK